MIEEFKKFAMRGNVVDLAVGVVIGAAFSRIVDSLVGDIFMPIVARIMGRLDFTNHFIGLTDAARAAPTYDAAKKAGATIGYGAFLTVAVNFVVIAWVLFLVIQAVNRATHRHEAAAPPQPPPAPPKPSRETELLTEIRDLLATQR